MCGIKELDLFVFLFLKVKNIVCVVHVQCLFPLNKNKKGQLVSCRIVIVAMEYAHELFDACVYLYIYVKPNSGNGRADYEYGNVQGP